MTLNQRDRSHPFHIFSPPRDYIEEVAVMTLCLCSMHANRTKLISPTADVAFVGHPEGEILILLTDLNNF